MTKEERIQKCSRIAEICNDNEEAMNLLRELQDEAPEPTNNYTDADVMDKDGVRWADKYAESRKQYRERFFGGSEEVVTPPAMEEKETEPEPDSITFDDLFK